MSTLATIAILGLGACIAFAVRKRLEIVGPLSGFVLASALALIATTPIDASATFLDLDLRVNALGKFAAFVLTATTLLLVIHVWTDEPAYNFFPTALAVAACVNAVLLLTSPLAMSLVLVFGLLVPVGSFTFHITSNRSVEAAIRHFSFVALGGCLAVAALALAAALPHDQPATTFVLLAVILFVAFALLLAVIPFHTHAALLVSEAPTSALALYFGVLCPTTLIAFVEILTVSGLLPAIAQVTKVQDLLMAIGLISSVGGTLLALGASDLRRLVVYSLIANLGSALSGLATLSGPGIVGALTLGLTAGACATQQLLAAGTLERRAGIDRPRAKYAPLAALAFIAGGLGVVGAPPLIGFPGRFFLELITFAYSTLAGTILVLSTLGLLAAQLRAALLLFGEPFELRAEPRPIAGITGGIVFAALLVGGLFPDTVLAPVAAFADEFLKAIRPL